MIERTSASVLHNNNLNYTSFATDYITLVAQKGGADALAIYTYLCAQSRHWIVRRDQCVSFLKISKARFTKAMRVLESLGFAYLKASRDVSGKMTGKSWHISALPRHISDAIEEHLSTNTVDNSEAHITDPTKNDASVDLFETPAESSVERIDRPPKKTVDRSSDQLTKDQKNQLSIKTTIKNTVRDCFSRLYEIYPSTRDKNRALEVFEQICKGLNVDEIEALTRKIELNICSLIALDENWREGNRFVTHFWRYLKKKSYEDELPTAKTSFEDDLTDFDAWKKNNNVSQPERLNDVV